MNGVSRFLSRRDKHHEKRHSKHTASKSRPVSTDLYTIFSNEELKIEKDDEKKVSAIIQRLRAAGIKELGEAQARYAISWYPNDQDAAFDVLLLANDSFEGVLRDYNPDVKMLGAVNRNNVTCYLDALLFAMFARLDAFEAMLFDNFNDEPRKRLAAILRLWVNLLRSGRLIKIELTEHLQDALAKCGWEEAAEVRQQDASEAFTFITDVLKLPLLTLKMDIYHTGREDEADDHKFVNERLLEVAIPEPEDEKVVTLEDCLETYFNNRIEVKRYLQRQNTLPSHQHVVDDKEKAETVHIEAVEVSGSESPMVATPTTLTPVSPGFPSRPAVLGRRRGDSIFGERYTLNRTMSEKKPFDEKRLLDEMLNDSPGARPRSASLLRKEVMMPAWQFFSLIPWYTDNVPQSDAQVAAHFSAKRPVLGICLKRYTMHTDGTPKKIDTFIDIPLEIGLPNFISDDRMEEEGPLFGNFKLVLQSVVCHRGVSVDSGHYVSLVRANLPHQSRRQSDSQSDDNPDSWLRFDDLSRERVSAVDIKQALKEESPYLLFYQVQPIDEELATRGDPPSYAQTQSELPTADPSRETLASVSNVGATDTEGTEWDRVTSANVSTTFDDPIGRTSMSSNHRSSVTFEDVDEIPGSRGRTSPPTPLEDKGGFLSTSRRNSKTWIGGGSKTSRPSSQSGENRLSITLSRLTGRSSKDKLHITTTTPPDTGNGAGEDPVIVIHETQSAENGGQNVTTSPVKDKLSGGLGRSKSRREKKEEKKRLRSKSREPMTVIEGVEKGKTKTKNRPDRECVLM